MTIRQPNVVPLRRRRGRPRKALPGTATGTVVPFPGPKCFVYHPADVADRRQGMFDMLQAASFSVLRGEIDGIMVTLAAGDEDGRTQFGIYGSFADDLDFAVAALGGAFKVIEDPEAEASLRLV